MTKDEVLECSFCGRKKPETDLLIAGLDAHICDKCIEQAHGIVVEELAESSSSSLSSELAMVLGNFTFRNSNMLPFSVKNHSYSPRTR